MWTVARRDLKLLELQPKAEGPRVAVQVRIPRERYEAWKREAGDTPVSVWLGELGDKASGWRG